MQSDNRRIRNPARGELCRSLAEYKPDRNRLNQILEKVSLKDVPLVERRLEAQKPLYLLRYE